MEKEEYTDEENFQKKKYIQINEPEEAEINIQLVENKKAKNKMTLTGLFFFNINK